MSEPRPKFSNEIALAAAKELAADLAKEDLIGPDQVEASARQIAKHARTHMDGYEIARELEKYSCWECNLQVAEALDGWSSIVRSHIEAAEKEWFARNTIQPPLPIDTRVKLHRGETGTITAIDKYGTAKYCVAIDGDPEAASSMQRRRIVNFEDVMAA